MVDQNDEGLSLGQLTDQEVLALVTLAREIVSLDRRQADADREGIEDLAEQIGPERFDTLLARSEELAGADEELEQLVASVERAEAREAIYGALFDLASESSIDPNELEVLDWLAEAWDLDVGDIDGDEDDDDDDGVLDDGDDEDDVDDVDEDDERGEP